MFQALLEAWAHSIEELNQVSALKKLRFLREVTNNKQMIQCMLC